MEEQTKKMPRGLNDTRRKIREGKNGKPKHSIQAGDSVQLKVWVSCGKDNTSSLSFIYDPNGPIQSFKISGSTLNNSLEYLGAC